MGSFFTLLYMLTLLASHHLGYAVFVHEKPPWPHSIRTLPGEQTRYQDVASMSIRS